jgi:hypothetical protein
MRRHHHNQLGVETVNKTGIADKGIKHFVTMEVRVFIEALIQHIPDRNFGSCILKGAAI